MPKKYTPLEMLNDIYCGVVRRAFGVRGRDDTGTSERLATEKTQATGNAFLQNIYSYIQNILSYFLDDIWGRRSKTDSGILALGSYYGEDNAAVATTKLQTKNIQTITVDENNYVYNIDQTTDSGRYVYAEIIDISIAGFNYSADTRLFIRYYAWDATLATYYEIWSNTIEYGTNSGLAFNSGKTFKTVPFADWNGYDNRYGYIEVELGGGSSMGISYVFDINIIINPIGDLA